MFDDIRWVFGQKFVHNDSLGRWSFRTNRAATRFMPKESFKMVRTDSWNTESSAAISLKLEWRFSVTISFTLAILTLVEDVDGRPERGKSSTTSRPLLNALYYSYAHVLHKVDSPYAFCNIFSDSAHEIPFAMQNLRQILCSIFLSIEKIAKHTWDEPTTSSTANELNNRSRSNSTSVQRIVVPT